jgi:enoyl-CoA hydratase/carnithine racemase
VQCYCRLHSMHCMKTANQFLCHVNNLIGMIAEMHDTPEKTMEAALNIARQMSAAAPLAVRTCVRTLRMAQDDGLDRALWREADAQAQVWNSSDMKTGLDGLVAKQKPVFTNFEKLVE